MNVLVASDSHGMAFRLVDAVQIEQPDLLLFLGDGARDLLQVRTVMPDLPIEQVRGNCDHWSDGEEERVLTLQDHSILLLHGHTQGVKRGLEKLWDFAQRKKVNAVLYGHTHVPSLSQKNGIYFFNPGSIGAFGQMSYGILKVEPGELQYQLISL